MLPRTIDESSKPVFVYAESTMETQQCVKFVQSLQLRHQNEVRPGVFIDNFEHISHIVLLLLLLTLKK